MSLLAVSGDGDQFMPSPFFRSERFLESETFTRGGWGIADRGSSAGSVGRVVLPGPRGGLMPLARLPI